MSKTKRMTVLAAIMLLAVVMFAACGGAEEPAITPATPTPTVDAGGDQQETDEPEVSTLISPDERTLTIMISEHSLQPIRDMAPAQEEILRQTGIRINFEAFPGGVYSERLNILLATGQLPDIVQLEGMANINNFYDAEIFLPLMQFSHLMPNFMEIWYSDPNLPMILRGPDRELFAFPVIRANEARGGYGPVIRTDLLARHDLPIPTTWEQVIDVLAELRVHYPDSAPWAPRRGFGRGLFDTTAYALGSGWDESHIVYYDADTSRYIFGPITPEFRDVIYFYRRAYERGVFAPDFANLSNDEWRTSLSSGRSFFYVDNTGFSMGFSRDLHHEDPDARFEFIGSLYNHHGQRRAQWTYGVARMFAINANIEDPETVVRFMDWMYSPMGTAISNFGVEGEHFFFDTDGQPQFLPEFVLQYQDVENPYYSIFADVGITMLNFAPHAANTWAAHQINNILGLFDEWQERHQYTMDNDPGYRFGNLFPPLSADESDRVRDLVADINTFLEQQYFRFVTGQVPMSDWDDVVVPALIRMGAQELEDIWNEALDRALGR
ncbi:MAG: extracellular solute-binding protein [Defluviitaleaceae bacterium]|nr:extracellular solute-binding protein [Defluviitaleaceae bacterium]